LGDVRPALHRRAAGGIVEKTRWRRATRKKDATRNAKLSMSYFFAMKEKPSLAFLMGL